MKWRSWRKLVPARKSTVVLIVLSVVAFLGTGLVLFGPSTPPASHSQSEAPGHHGPSSSTTRPAALFIGDAYTIGPDGGPTPDASYACLAATKMGWQCSVVAQDGTGYASGGPGHRLRKEYGVRDTDSTSFAERFPRLRELYQANVVVLDGGRADIRLDMPDLRNAFERTVRQAMEAWPNSRIVVIAPWLISQPAIHPPSANGRTIGEELESVLKSSPDFDKVIFIDPGALKWFDGVDTSPLTADDGVHPNVLGEQKIAELLAAALNHAGLANVA
jgi:GDSL-like Lipase/Acylhydrolase family